MKPIRITLTFPEGKTFVGHAGECTSRNKRPVLDDMERIVAANALRRLAYQLNRSAR